MSKLFERHIIFIQLIAFAAILCGCQEDDEPHGPVITIKEEPQLYIVERGETPAINPNAPKDDQTNLDYLFQLNSLPAVVIYLTEDDWNQYLTNFDENADNRKYVPARFSIQKGKDIVYYRDSIGLRPRGNTSRVRPEGEYGEKHNALSPQWHHAHFGVKFTEYKSGKRLFGADRIIFKWLRDDPSYCREIYCYDLLRRFNVWSAPRASFCRLYLMIDGDQKPAYFGVYEMVESIRKGWLDDKYNKGLIPDENGNIWKAQPWHEKASLYNPDPNIMGVEDDESSSTHQYVYALKSNKNYGLISAKQELINFIVQMRSLKSGSEELQQWLETNVDVDVFLRQQAVNIVVGSWDDYWGTGNNYYFYFDNAHKFYFIPYDYDHTLGSTSLHFNAVTQDPLLWGGLGNEQILVERILSVPQYKRRYIHYLKQLISTPNLFDAQQSMARIREWQAMIAPYVANDTGEDMEIIDEPAWWSTPDYYRLLSNDTATNFFYAKINNLKQYTDEND